MKNIRKSFSKPTVFRDKTMEGMPQASGTMFRGIPAGRGVGIIQISEFNRRASVAWRSAPIPETIERLET